MSCYKIIVEDGIVHIRFHGRPTLKDVLACFSELQDMPDTRYRLWYFEEGIDLQSGDVRYVADFTSNLGVQPERVALVSAHDPGYGLLRMFQSYRNDQGVEVRVFRNYDEAYNFLRSG